MYFMVKSCIHTVWPPELDQNMPYLSPISPASTKFCTILQKHTYSYSAETGKFRGSAQNSAFRGKLWSLSIDVKIDWNFVKCVLEISWKFVRLDL